MTSDETTPPRRGPSQIEAIVFPYSVPEPPPANGMTLSEFWVNALNAERLRGSSLDAVNVRAWLNWINRG